MNNLKIKTDQQLEHDLKLLEIIRKNYYKKVENKGVRLIFNKVY